MQYIPSIWVIDAEGKIRHRDLSGEKLEEAVAALVEGAARPASGTKDG